MAARAVNAAPDRVKVRPTVYVLDSGDDSEGIRIVDIGNGKARVSRVYTSYDSTDMIEGWSICSENEFTFNINDLKTALEAFNG